jgi:hypothetical protein
MTRLPFSSALLIKCARSYKVDELLNLMVENLSDEYRPFAIKKLLGMKKVVQAQGVDKWVFWVSSSRKRILCQQNKPFLQRIKDTIPLTIICCLTLGIGFIIWRAVDEVKFWFGLEGTKASRAKLRAMAEGIEKLVKK